MRSPIVLLMVLWCLQLHGQADNEIQVYASPTIQHKGTIFELHNNYTFKGSKLLPNPKDARWYNTTLEITHGFAKNFEIGFYTFAGIAPGGGLPVSRQPGTTAGDGAGIMEMGCGRQSFS